MSVEYYKVKHNFLAGLDTTDIDANNIVADSISVTSLTALSTYVTVSEVTQITSETALLTGNLMINGLFEAKDAYFKSLTAERFIAGTNSYLLSTPSSVATNSYILGSNISTDIPNYTFIENLSVIGEVKMASSSIATEINKAKITDLEVESLTAIDGKFVSISSDNADITNLQVDSILFNDPFNPGFSNLIDAVSALLRNEFVITTFTVNNTGSVFIQPGDTPTLNFRWSHSKLDQQAVKEFTFYFSDSAVSGNYSFKGYDLSLPYTSYESVSTFTVSGTDTYGVSSEAFTFVRNVGLIYYGTLLFNNPTGDDITSIDNYILIKHSDRVKQKITYDCTGGKYYYVAYPVSLNYIPSVMANNFSQEIYSNENYIIPVLNEYGVSIDYRVLISNYKQYSDDILIEYIN